MKHAKPPASRKDSSEWYVVAQGFKGGEIGFSTRLARPQVGPLFV